jgi:NADH-quinone oxidoreductase B subunit
MGLIDWARRCSPWLMHFNAGSCNGCDIEVTATLTPKYDLERFGVLLKGSPRHADILAVTGPVTRQARSRLEAIFEQMPYPKHVIAIGTCATSGAPFRASYNITQGVDQVLSVDMYVPGCPPKPEAIIHGILRLTGKITDAD